MIDQVLGIVGFGFVGKAIQHGFAQSAEFRIHDVNPLESINTFEEVMEESDIIFLCVPTPMDLDTGIQDLRILDSVMAKCVEHVNNTDKVLVIKSTVLPGTTQRYSNLYPHARIVFNPEFLTERTYRLDFINQSRIVLGGAKEDTDLVAKIYETRFPTTPIFHTSATAAEIVKYACNCFFAVKVGYLNELYQICDAHDVDYDDVIGMSLADGRIGNSHWEVPGHDGDFGFGGKCFPKDINALIKHAEDMGVDAKIMKATWEKNLEVRSNHDWLEIKGAVTGKEEEEEDE